MWLYTIAAVVLLCSHAAGHNSLAEGETVVPYCARERHAMGGEEEEEFDNPGVFSGGIGTVRTYEGCLQRLRDRFVIVTPQRTTPSPKLLPPCRHFLQRNEALVLYYLASDLCRLGHTTKDAPHLMAFLLDYLAPCSIQCRQLDPKDATARLRVHLTLFYGNVCASYPSPRLDSSFRAVILGWFHALFRSDSPFIALMTSWGIDFVATTSSSGNTTLRVDEIFYKEAMKERGFFCPRTSETSAATAADAALLPPSVGREDLWIISRWERFRWFRTRAQAGFFRKCLLWYYDVPNPGDGVTVLLLQRLGERHFEERVWYEKLQTRLRSCGVGVTMQTFIRMPYARQASFMHNTSIFIAAHGAGVVNIMAMRPGSVVVELFPHGFRYAMYQELAELLGLHYIAYESPVVWPLRCCNVHWEDAKTRFAPPLKGNPPMMSFGARRCKECDIRVSEGDMDSIMHDALGLVTAHRRLQQE